jgi:probable HAF family extracellular repeat protein
VISDLGFLGPSDPPDGRSGKAFGINDGGDIVGAAYFQISHAPFGPHAFLFSTLTGATVDIGTLGGVDSYAWGINNSGVVVGKSGTQTTESLFNVSFGWSGDQTIGYRAFRWTASRGMQDLGPGSANAINRHGWIAGSDGQAFVLRPGGKRVYLGPTTVSANAINDKGVVVGNPAFRYDGHSVVDLNSFVVGSGWTLVTATGINSSGQIVGQGIINGVKRGYLLTPN